jgi:hypothetical protein
LVDPRGVKAMRTSARTLCQFESECVAALAEPVSGEEYARRVERGELIEGVPLRLALARARSAGSVLASLPTEDVVAYLDSRDGETLREVAVVRGGRGLYAIATSAPASTLEQLKQLGSTTHSYLATCVWGARAEPAKCSPG